eukprot:6063678-Alexandrium_andersonii.AAC.1
MSALGVRWEGGRAESAPLLDGFSWDELGPSSGFAGSGPAPAGAPSSRAETRSNQARVSWADAVDAHDETQCAPHLSEP